MLNENEVFYQTNLVPLCQCRHCLDRTMLKCRNRTYNIRGGTQNFPELLKKKLFEVFIQV